MSGTTLKLEGLNQLLTALKSSRRPQIRVGILGGSTAREGSITNAQVGAFHEFGTTQLPQRSFLRVPISDNLQKEMQAAGALDADVLEAVVASGSVLPWLRKIAVLCEGIVAEAFATGGFGKWKPSDMTHKKNHQTLVETAQLRNSITSEVKE